MEDNFGEEFGEIVEPSQDTELKKLVKADKGVVREVMASPLYRIVMEYINSYKFIASEQANNLTSPPDIYRAQGKVRMCRDIAVLLKNIEKMAEFTPVRKKKPLKTKETEKKD